MNKEVQQLLGRSSVLWLVVLEKLMFRFGLPIVETEPSKKEGGKEDEKKYQETTEDMGTLISIVITKRPCPARSSRTD